MALLLVLACREDVQDEMLHIKTRYEEGGKMTENLQREDSCLRVVADQIVLNSLKEYFFVGQEGLNL